MSAIGKQPVAGRVRVAGEQVEGTSRPTAACTAGRTRRSTPTPPRTRRGGRRSSAASSPPAMFGENLTTAGVDVSGALVGERWRIGELELEVCQPRLPCYKLGLKFGDPLMLKRFAKAERPGAYLRIIAAGRDRRGRRDRGRLPPGPRRQRAARLAGAADRRDAARPGRRGAAAAGRARYLDARTRRLGAGEPAERALGADALRGARARPGSRRAPPCVRSGGSTAPRSASSSASVIAGLDLAREHVARAAAVAELGLLTPQQLVRQPALERLAQQPLLGLARARRASPRPAAAAPSRSPRGPGTARAPRGRGPSSPGRSAAG